ncbi:hypothetical protein SOCE26_107120 [Sorangium cellulosum]|uniref:Uncharacterized protein n=1 Tax=Sorangium cellulosum TaxID=56 RepID=A0A2L0FCC2_SORCE|nr:hypothetical protein [Sorangium cellulosum]AUX49167.1 hypothetical protein SOCE26_107120 [Sorangium cellulosum]
MEPSQRAPQGSAPADRRPPPPEEEPEGFAWKGALGVALVVGALVVWRACSAPESGAGGSSAPATPGASAAAPGANDPADPAGAAALPPPRCAAAGPAPFVIGDAPPAPRGPEQGAGGGEPTGPEDLAPFAVEIGRGTTFSGGFAVGAQREAEGGTVAMVATLSADGAQGKLVRLARSRGDMDPPVVAGAGGAILAAMLEPNAGGRAIKIAKIDGEHVTWGAELAEGRDESLALDVAASGERAVVVWDDVTRDGKRSRIMLASADVGTMRSVTSPRPVSQPSTDAETPRVIARPGGYWLAYIARAEEPARRASAKAGDDDEDTAAAGETITHQWIEVAPMDETGALTNTPRAITPKDGHVLAYDLTLGEDDGLILAFRDDDTPSGSSGGRIGTVLVRLGGAGEPRVIVGGDREQDTPPEAALGVGAGVPALLPGSRGRAPGGQPGAAGAHAAAWLAIANASGPTQLAALTARGELEGGLHAEPALGRGEPIAAQAEALLVAHPAGKAMKLGVLRCTLATPASK